MTLRLPADPDADLRAAAEEDHRSVHQAVVHAVDTYLAQRETAEIKADLSAKNWTAYAAPGSAEPGGCSTRSTTLSRR